MLNLFNWKLMERMTEGRLGHHASWGSSYGRSPARTHCLMNVGVPPSRELCAVISSVTLTTSACSFAAVVALALGVESVTPLSCIEVLRDSISEGSALLLTSGFWLPAYTSRHVQVTND